MQQQQKKELEETMDHHLKTCSRRIWVENVVQRSIFLQRLRIISIKIGEFFKILFHTRWTCHQKGHFRTCAELAITWTIFEKSSKFEKIQSSYWLAQSKTIKNFCRNLYPVHSNSLKLIRKMQIFFMVVNRVQDQFQWPIGEQVSPEEYWSCDMYPVEFRNLVVLN